ncbi:MAG TPA: calcium-binding protein, partial [Candidatus Marinimicrobia bacterium]|nr:calcium-binding protein [Candidatus Neomarinimicrobiota bacterium]
GNNTVTFSELADGTYSDCTITVTDSATNTSSTLNVNTFIVDTTSQTLYGTSGDDTFNGGAGSDTLYGYAGNDVFNITSKSGSFTDTIYGGAGTDSLVVNYTGISSLDNFTIGYNSSTSTFTFTDPSGGVINAKDIETFSFGGKSYTHYTGQDGGTDINRNVKGFWSVSENLLMVYGGASSFLRDFDEANKNLSGHSKNENLTIIGSSGNDSIGIGSIGKADDSNDFSGTLTLKTLGGSDYVSMYQPSGSSSDSTNHIIDLGDGDDTYTTGPAQTVALSKLDGGAGSDTLQFGGTNTIALTLTTAGAINFENLQGGGGNDNISGDNSANILLGSNGANTIYGYGGNDILGGHNASVSNGDYDNDVLYGGAGNDTLYGTGGECKLDGGTGQDNMTGGNGSDTFIIRSGDGGSALTDADIIMDFQDGTDVIGLSGGLSFNDLTIAQGSGSNSSHTIIRITSSGEYLVIVKNISASNISGADFNILN